MAKKKYISLSNLTSFFNNLKNLFATKTDVEAKSDKSHTHSISDVTNLQTTLNGKANSSHGTHVTFSTTSPAMDGTASVGSATTVARSDHKHPTDTSRASQTSLDALEDVVAGKANSSHTHIISNITNLQSTLDSKASSGHTHSIANVSGLQSALDEFKVITSEEVQSLFS